MWALDKTQQRGINRWNHSNDKHTGKNTANSNWGLPTLQRARPWDPKGWEQGGGFFGPARLRAWDSTVSSSGVRGGDLKNLDLEVLWVLMSERSLSEVQHCLSLLLYSSTYCCYYGTGSIPGRQVVAASTTVIHTQARYCLLTANWGYVTTEW